MTTRKKTKTFGRIGAAAMILMAVVLLVLLLGALCNLDRDQDEQALLQLEEALRRNTVACYAAEGFYPPDVAYLEEHYGLLIDHDRYQVHYEIYGSNLMPNITVLKKEQ